MQTKAVAAICVFASLWCASSAYLDGAGRDQLARQHGAAAYADKSKVIAELEQDVARLQAQALAEGKSGGCKQNCRAVNEQVAVAAQRLAAARAEKAAATPVEVSGMATAIAAITGTDINETMRGVGVLRAMLFIVLVEALVWLSIPAMALLASATLARAEPESTEMLAEIVVDAEPVAVIEGLAAVAPKPGTSAYYMARLQRDHPAIAQRVVAGEISVYKASIEAGLRKAPTKSATWTSPDAYMRPASVTA